MAPALPIDRSGDFGRSPFFGQLSGKLSPASLYASVVLKSKHKGFVKNLIVSFFGPKPPSSDGEGFSRFFAPMSYTTGSHTVFHHRYHIVWITKYRYKVLEGALRDRIRTIIQQVCKELGVQIVSGVLSKEHVHMFVEIPPHIAVSDFVRRVKGRSSHRVQMEFPDLRKRYWGRHFWARGYFCTTSGNITDDVIQCR